MMTINNILDKVSKDHWNLTESDVLTLLSVSNDSKEFYELLAASNRYSRVNFKNRAYVFVQIGLNSEPCSGNCLFCSMGANHFAVDKVWRKNPQDVIDEIQKINQDDIDDIFLMTTADYPFEEYLEVVEKVKPLLDSRIRLVANYRDFNVKEGNLMKEAGITGAYHVNRLREGIDTGLDIQDRLSTLNSIKQIGLELYYCIEPIGAEHSYNEIVTEILRARSLQPEVMAVMRRVGVPNSPVFDRGEISAIELVKIAAVTNLVVKPSRAMNLHESEQMSLLAGVNQLYAEIGANPRDTNARTELSRGISVSQARKMFHEVDYIVS